MSKNKLEGTLSFDVRGDFCHSESGNKAEKWFFDTSNRFITAVLEDGGRCAPQMLVDSMFRSFGPVLQEVFALRDHVSTIENDLSHDRNPKKW